MRRTKTGTPGRRPLHATGDGIVVAAGDSQPDNMRGGASFFKETGVKTAPMSFYGNHLVIDHGNGEFGLLGLLGLLQRSSLSVKVGGRVSRGQLVARIGSSGSSNDAHVHYELRTGKNLQVEGLPAIFQYCAWHLGAKTITV